jgi:ribonuclease R
VLYVAIADVSYFVKEGSVLDKEAFKKSTSAYLPGKVLPMLPNELSEDMCSLKEGVDRYSYVFKIELDLEKLEVKKSELFEAIINSHRKFSYGRIDRVLDEKLDRYTEQEKEIFDYLVPLYEVTKLFRQKRLEKGYDFRSSEYRLRLDNNSELQSIEVETSSPSHQLVEECMLFANIEASKKVNSVGIFRIHEEPPFKAISKLIDDVNALGVKAKLQNDVHDTITHIQEKAKYSTLREEIDELIIHAQTQAKYSSRNLGHFGLGFNSYSHFTSPIRRYSDLVLHRMLKTRQTPKNIDEICEHISIQERKIDQMVWDFEDRKYARWAAKNIGLEVKAKVTDNERGVCVTFGQIAGAKIHLDNYKGQVLFSKIRVIIKSADIISKRVIGSVKY